jgi:hypothetical protein
MDNFDLKKYLAEGKLNEEVKSFSFDSVDLGILIDGLGWIIEYQEGVAPDDYISDVKYLLKKLEGEVNETIVKEGDEDGGAEEEAFDAEFQSAANQIAATIGRELKDKKGENPEELNEAVVTSIIAGVLTGNAVLGFISKMSAKLMKKLNWKKGEDFAEKVHKWAHDNEKSFQEPIRRVLAFFIKDKVKLDITVKAIYAIVVGSMAAGYGVSAVSSLEKADWFNSSLSALKTLAKSDEAIANAFPAIKSLMV